MNVGDIVRLKEERHNHWYADVNYGGNDGGGGMRVQELPAGTLFRILKLNGSIGCFGRLDKSYSISSIHIQQFEPL
jgi:hypothetical protein